MDWNVVEWRGPGGVMQKNIPRWTLAVTSSTSVGHMEMPFAPTWAFSSGTESGCHAEHSSSARFCPKRLRQGS